MLQPEWHFSWCIASIPISYNAIREKAISQFSFVTRRIFAHIMGVAEDRHCGWPLQFIEQASSMSHAKFKVREHQQWQCQNYGQNEPHFWKLKRKANTMTRKDDPTSSSWGLEMRVGCRDAGLNTATTLLNSQIKETFKKLAGFHRITMSRQKCSTKRTLTHVPCI